MDARRQLLVDRCRSMESRRLCFARSRHRYQSPDACRSFSFEGQLVDLPGAFRGTYGELEPVKFSAEQLMGTIMQQGLDHHWILGFGHWASKLTMLNHWLGVDEVPVSHSGGVSGLLNGLGLHKRMGFASVVVSRVALWLGGRTGLPTLVDSLKNMRHS